MFRRQMCGTVSGRLLSSSSAPLHRRNSGTAPREMLPQKRPESQWRLPTVPQRRLSLAAWIRRTQKMARHFAQSTDWTRGTAWPEAGTAVFMTDHLSDMDAYLEYTSGVSAVKAISSQRTFHWGLFLFHVSAASRLNSTSPIW